MEDEGYEILMTVREDNQYMRILSQQGERSILKNVAIINRDGSDFSAIMIDGSIRLKDLDRVLDE